MSWSVIVKKIQENQYKSKMFFIILAIAIVLAMIIWYFFVERVAKYDIEIKPSNNITFNSQIPQGFEPVDLYKEFYPQKNKLSLIYFYATWCDACRKNFEIINEIAREFQNTKLNFLALAIDKDLDPDSLQKHLQQYDNLYFKPIYLKSRDGFGEFVHRNNINYRGRIPYLALIDSNGQLVVSFSGIKSRKYLRKKIIENLYLK